MNAPDLDVPVWKAEGDYRDIIYEHADGMAKITINRPEVRNAFRPQTIFELSHAFDVARDDPEIGVVILTGQGTEAFCSGGDQRIRADDGYLGDDELAVRGIGRLNVLDLQIQIRRLPKPVIAMVVGTRSAAATSCTLSAISRSPRTMRASARTGRASAALTGDSEQDCSRGRSARNAPKEIWFLCRRYDARRAYEMGLVNAVVPLDRLEGETVAWCREMLQLSPTALRLLKAGFNAAEDGLAGIQQLAGDATMLFYMTEEAQEGRDAFVEKRNPDFSRFPRRP